ncbi:MAG TPA: pilus assembly protein PilP [Dissulfurispiraceae bacterium]|nr:pilus assembly protein PilP [Dissulfurispiraceae bacterium]
MGRVLISIFLAGAVFIAVGAFAEGIKAYAAQPAVSAAAGAEVPKKEGAYEYSGLDRRDPFAPLVSKREAGKEKGIAPLEAYDVNEVKVIAILWAKTKYYAVFSLPDGKSYTVNEGAKVGTRNGVITKITKDQVVIKERVRDARGSMSPRDTVLRLRGEDEE